MLTPARRRSVRPRLVALAAVAFLVAVTAAPAAAVTPTTVTGPVAVRIFRVAPAGGGIGQVTLNAASRTVLLSARGLRPSGTYQLRATIGPSRPVITTAVATSSGTINVTVPWRRSAGSIASVTSVALVRSVAPLVPVLHDGYWPDSCEPPLPQAPTTCDYTFDAYQSSGPIALYQLSWYQEDPNGNGSWGVPYRGHDQSLGALRIPFTLGPGYYAEATLDVYDIYGNDVGDTLTIVWAG